MIGRLISVGGFTALSRIAGFIRDILMAAILLVRPRGLIAHATYEVTSLDIGPLGSARGDALMQDGIEIVHAGGSRAHVLLLKTQ